MLRVLPLFAAVILLLAPASQARLVSAPPASSPPSTSENASTAFFESGSESRIGLLCHNDPVNHSDPMGLIIDYDYTDPGDASAARTLITRLEGMGGEIANAVQKLQESPRTITFIPIQRTESGLNKYSLPPHEKGQENTNRTTPGNEANSRNGTGTGSRVELDPKNSNSASGKRDPVVGAGHEVRHALANAQGNRLPGSAEEKRAQDFERLIRKKLQDGK